MARAAAPIFSPSCGLTRMIAGLAELVVAAFVRLVPAMGQARYTQVLSPLPLREGAGGGVLVFSCEAPLPLTPSRKGRGDKTGSGILRLALTRARRRGTACR